MPSTNSPNKGYELQATGENQGTWGVILNNNALSVVDLNLGGRLAVTIDAANVDLSAAQAQNVYITLTGVLTGNRDLTFPATNGGFYYILNSTSGSFAVTVKPLGGTGVVIPQGALSKIFINPTATTAVHLAAPNTAAGTAILPISSDGTAIGSTSLMWSDLFLASGGVINWNAGNVTLTHSSGVLTIANTVGNSSTLILQTSEDGAFYGATLEQYRISASPAVNDILAGTLIYGRDSAANKQLYYNSYVTIVSPTSTAEEGRVTQSVTIAGVDTVVTTLDTAGLKVGRGLSPLATDTAALGTTSLMWSDLFLASGGVVNWNNGDVTITHSANTLAFAGASSGYTFDVPIAVTSGGTGASSASAARTALGLVIGTDVQAYSARLGEIAALAVTDSNIIVGNGAAWVAESGATARTSLGLAIGTNVQAWSATLDSVAASSYTGDNAITTLGTITTGVWTGTTIAVANGGTGATTLTGLLQGNGTGAITGGATINNSNWSGTDLSVANGGTGASTLTGLLQGNGTGAITGGATVNNDNWSGTDLSVANGGTGASSFVAAQLCSIKTGSYTGDGTTSKAITGVGFTPKYVKIWPRITTNAASSFSYETTPEIIDDNASGGAICQTTNNADPGAPFFFANAIIALGADGFTVDDGGVDDPPNKNGTVYNYLCLG